MNKIIKAALTATFPHLSIDVLLEVINATQNPVTATEKLIGVFEAPFLRKLWKRADSERELIRFDWNRPDSDQVEYRYYQTSDLCRYLAYEDAILYDEKQSDEERREFLTSKGKYKSEGSFTHPKITRVKNSYASSCSVVEWQSHHYDDLDELAKYAEQLVSDI